MRTVAGLVAAAKATIENLSPDALVCELDVGKVVLVDLREPEELARSGVIGCAIHVPRGMLEFCADATSPYHRPELRPDRRIILYCASGGRSALAVKALESLGFRNLAHLEGGVNAWRALGLPTSQAAPERVQSDREATRRHP